MLETDKTPVVLKGAGPDHTHGDVVIRIWGTREALQKAMVWTGACWILAFGAIFIPVVHFVLVPLLILVGPAVGLGMFKLFNGYKEIVEGRGTCPNCGAGTALKGGDAKWPRQDICSQCSQAFDFRPQ